jgi:Ni/Co efflux regulator RcnB
VGIAASTRGGLTLGLGECSFALRLRAAIAEALHQRRLEAMKRLVVLSTICLFAISLSAEALAQGPRPGDGQGRPGGGGKPGGEQGKPGPGKPGGSKPSPGRPNPGRPGGDHNQGPRPGRGSGPGRPPPRPSPSRPSRPPPRPGRPSPGRGGPGRYQLGGYRRPPGYFHRRWTTGAILPRFFFGQSYWLTPGPYGLRPPPFGTHWVRVDDDALLVTDSTGRIVDVVRGIFY